MPNITRSRYFRRILNILPVLAFLPISSCAVYWNTGACVRDKGKTYVGVDTSRPLSDVVYLDKQGNFYMLAPEVSYSLSHRICGWISCRQEGSTSPKDEIIEDIQQTGQSHWVHVDCALEKGHARFTGGSGFKGISTPPPADAKAVSLQNDSMSQYWGCKEYGVLETSTTSLHSFYTAASYPLQYLVDPALMLVSNAVAYTVYIPATIIGFPFHLYARSQREEERNRH